MNLVVIKHIFDLIFVCILSYRYIVSSTETSISTCPGALQCSGHGVCDTDTFQCYCSYGWTGGDCSQMACPAGLSWFSYPTADNAAHSDYALCSNMGLCDYATGICKCRPGFFGSACEYMGCGGDPSKTCSGHGRCMTMAELALWANDNGDATQYVYGSDPNNPYTWDYSRIHGCFCDEGYSGYDCSLTDCIRGDDPGTYDDQSEVQLLQCIADSGNFTLTFRQAATPPLPYNITAFELQQALSNLKTIGNIRVYFMYDGPPPEGILTYELPDKALPPGSNPWGSFSLVNNTVQFNYNPPLVRGDNSTFCRTDGTQVAIIEFAYTQSDVPALLLKSNYLYDSVNAAGGIGSGHLNIIEDGQSILGLQSIRGTTENDVCNNRGLCNTETGQCQCFNTWTSSNGARQGGPGDSGDCGYRNDKLYSFFNSQGPSP